MTSSNDFLAFIESNTTGSGMQALRKAQELALRPVLFTRDAGLYPDISPTGCLVEICETNDIDLLRRAVAHFSQHNPGQLRGITTTSEFYTESVAVLAQEHRLPANAPEAIQRCRDKVQTRDVLTRAGFLQPRFALIRGIDDIDRLIPSDSFPCIIKPRSDTGSYGVKLCMNREDARKHASWLLNQKTNVRGQSLADGVLYEEYIEAPEFSVETFAWQGEIVCIGITQKKLTGFPHFVECGHLFPAQLSHQEEEEIRRTVLQALQTIGNTNGPIHTEVKLVGHRCLIIEINPRLAGGMIPELVYQAQGVDLLHAQLCVACGFPPHLQQERAAYAGIHFLTAPMNGTLEQVMVSDKAYEQCNIVKKSINAHPGKSVKVPTSAYDRLGYLILRAPSYAILAQQLEAITEEIAIVITPTCNVVQG